jgi:hypothetical protein
LVCDPQFPASRFIFAPTAGNNIFEFFQPRERYFPPSGQSRQVKPKQPGKLKTTIVYDDFGRIQSELIKKKSAR